MGTASSPPKSVVQTVTAAGKFVLRSVKLLGAERPAGVPWKCKVNFSDTRLTFTRNTRDPTTAYASVKELGLVCDCKKQPACKT